MFSSAFVEERRGLRAAAAARSRVVSRDFRTKEMTWAARIVPIFGSFGLAIAALSTDIGEVTSRTRRPLTPHHPAKPNPSLA